MSLTDGLTKIILVIEYEGTNYCGFQIQTEQPTIQGELEQALKKLTGEDIRIRGASRTDAGVHAKGQVASFKTVSRLPLNTFVEAMNHYLPEDIAVKSAREAPETLDVRHGAVSRDYRYTIHNCNTRSPLQQRFAHLVPQPLDIGIMNQACEKLIGVHDFASFAACVEEGKATIRRVNLADVIKQGETVTFNMIANAFLPHQIRNTVGALIRLGLGKTSLKEFCDIMESKTPGLAGPTAPACGLCLMQVNYA